MNQLLPDRRVAFGSPRLGQIGCGLGQIDSSRSQEGHAAAHPAQSERDSHLDHPGMAQLASPPCGREAGWSAGGSLAQGSVQPAYKYADTQLVVGSCARTALWSVGGCKVVPAASGAKGAGACTAAVVRAPVDEPRRRSRVHSSLSALEFKRCCFSVEWDPPRRSGTLVTGVEGR